MRRRAREFRKNWKFFVGMVVAAAAAGLVAAFLSRGIGVGLDTLSIVEKARQHPDQLTDQEKAELKKIYEGLSPDEKELARSKAAPR